MYLDKIGPTADGGGGGGGIIRPIGLVWPGIRPDYIIGFGLARSFAPNENLNLAKRS